MSSSKLRKYQRYNHQGFFGTDFDIDETSEAYELTVHDSPFISTYNGQGITIQINAQFSGIAKKRFTPIKSFLIVKGTLAEKCLRSHGNGIFIPT